MIFVLLHELCHLMMAFYFKFNIKGLQIYPFGTCVIIDDFFYNNMYKELCVVLAGPLFHIIADLILYIIDADILREINLTILLFNILPIYPLDGCKIIILILSLIGDLKNAMYYSLKISLLTLSVLSVFYINTNTIVMILFLFYNQIRYYQYINYYLYKSLIKIKKETKDIINSSYIYRRGYNNYYYIQGYIYNQSQVLNILLKNITRQ